MKKATDESIETVYVYRFEIITDCPFESAEGVKQSLESNSDGYTYKVKQLKVLK